MSAPTAPVASPFAPCPQCGALLQVRAWRRPDEAHTVPWWDPGEDALTPITGREHLCPEEAV